MIGHFGLCTTDFYKTLLIMDSCGFWWEHGGRGFDGWSRILPKYPNEQKFNSSTQKMNLLTQKMNSSMQKFILPMQ